MAAMRVAESSNTTPTSAGFSGRTELRSNAIHSATSSPASERVQAGTTHALRPPTPPLLRAPVGQTFSLHVKSWGATEIATFLSLYNCDHYTPLFHSNDIDGRVLLDLDMANLKEIGIAKIGDRVKLLGGVRDLRRRAARAAPSLATRTQSYVPADISTSLLHEDDSTKISQVPKRLATALVSKRLQLSRPPPLDLQRRNPLSSLEPPPLASPSSRSVTPKTVHTVFPSRSPLQQVDHGQSSTSGADIGQTLRLPGAAEARRSPSPSAEEHNPHGTGRAEPQTRGGERKPAASFSRLAEVSHRGDQSASPTQGRSQLSPVQPDGNSHPFASMISNKDQTADSLSMRDGTRAPTRTASAALASSSHASTSYDHSARHPQPTLEDLRRHLVKFLNTEDNTTKTVNVASCSTGVDVLERVLKKFGKWHTGSLGAETDSENDRLVVDGWGVYIKSGGDGDDIPLSESALLDICQGHKSTRLGAQHDPAVLRERGLLLRRVSHSLNRKNMEFFFGPQPTSPHSPSPYGITHLTSPRTGSSKQMNRASTVSVMSALCVPDVADAVSSPSSNRSSTVGNPTPSRSKRMYNFFGHRPPSELISNHLAEYFPSARKRDLEKTVRQSMLRLSQGQVDRLSLAPLPNVGTSPSAASSADDIASPSRYTRPLSTRTLSSSTAPIPEENEAHGASRESASRTAPVDAHPPLLPPFESTGESLVDSLQQYSSAPSTARPSLRPARRGSAGSTLSRISVISSVRKSKDKSDNASLLTVDEITAEVDNRRASMSTFIDNLETASDTILSEDGSGGSGEEDGYSSGSSEDSDDKGQGRAYTSTGSRRMIRWIKGALIGAGSFGSVFLGMDAQSGLLMAVKQVELPSGDVRNEERKRNMVQALEREIELLRELQHENIVQYLDSATDGNNLYIFLEYVPGGSVAALLNNYGAFEEALVRNFVRQILTGLNYLHERNIIHRDIKGANILVDNKGGIKISDFGISKKAESHLMDRANRPSLQGSVFWMAPEVVKQTIYTSKADIWSVGCLVVEMLTGTHPWADLSQMQAIFKIGSLVRPTTPNDISPEAADFLRCTFEINHTTRPTAAALLDHPFISAQHNSDGIISLQQANATMEAVAASRKTHGPMMPGFRINEL